MNTRTLIASLFVAALLLSSGTAAFAASSLPAESNASYTSQGHGHGGGYGGGHGGGYGGGRGGCGGSW